jgi:hypothetical protein
MLQCEELDSEVTGQLQNVKVCDRRHACWKKYIKRQTDGILGWKFQWSALTMYLKERDGKPNKEG